MNLKQLTEVSVLRSAQLLMETDPQNETTTLEVKMVLRQLGFSATQAEVSRYMQEIRRNEDWEQRYETAPSGEVFLKYSQKVLDNSQDLDDNVSTDSEDEAEAA